jgi:PhnB protein
MLINPDQVLDGGLDTAETGTMSHTITPHIVVRDAEHAARWYVEALGAELGNRVALPNGKFMQIELRFGDSQVMIADEFPELGVVSPLTLGGTYGALTIATSDVDAAWERALGAGAFVFHPLQDTFWGDRHGQLIDPFGHRWGLAQHVRDVPAEEVARAAAAAFGKGH